MDKKTEMLVKGESLNWGEKEAPVSVEKRAQHAIAEWSSYWKGQDGYEKQEGPALRPITANRIKRVLKRMSAPKAKVLGHWGPEELRDLPHVYLEGLADILNKAEIQGEWPK